MKKNLTELILVVDRSSSMSDVRLSTVSALKEYLNTQKQLPGEALLTYITFSSDYKVELEGKNIKEVNDNIFDTYVASGMTALLDAIGVAIDSVGKRFADMEESKRPEKVMMIILTDGEENSSKEYKLMQIKDKVKHQESVYKWEFLFLGADIDAISSGSSISMSKSVSLNKHDMMTNMSKATLYSGSFRGADLKDSSNKFSTISTNYFNFSEAELKSEIENLKDGK